MWLLNAHTFALEHVEDERRVRYAILSHTWGDDEVSFKDMQSLADAKTRKGFAKIEYCCTQAQSDQLRYVWIDTCCIDKSSSADLSEAINSMFKWYQTSTVCYAYLSDLATPKGPIVDAVAARVQWAKDFRACRWFSRGWTLQELIAPAQLRFYNATWQQVGTKSELIRVLADITGIEPIVLGTARQRQAAILDSMSVAAKMSWAARRFTTREEDEAYSLMGLFDVNMPLLYGEGRKAFRRLQEHIIAKSTDHSVLLWSPQGQDIGQLFASSPSAFWRCSSVVKCSEKSWPQKEFTLTNMGIRTVLPVVTLAGPKLYAMLSFRYADDVRGQILLPLKRFDTESERAGNGYGRVGLVNHDVGVRFPTLRKQHSAMAQRTLSAESLLFIEDKTALTDTLMVRANFVFELCETFMHAFPRTEAVPRTNYNGNTQTMSWLTMYPKHFSGPEENLSASITWSKADGQGVKLVIELARSWPDNNYAITVMDVQRATSSHQVGSRIRYTAAVHQQFPLEGKSGSYTLRDGGVVSVKMEETPTLDTTVFTMHISYTPATAERQQQQQEAEFAQPEEDMISMMDSTTLAEITLQE